jgi:hypothetical protein
MVDIVDGPFHSTLWLVEKTKDFVDLAPANRYLRLIAYYGLLYIREDTLDGKINFYGIGNKPAISVLPLYDVVAIRFYPDRIKETDKVTIKMLESLDV